MPYWRLFYHVVWTTRSRSPQIDCDIEILLQRSIRSTCSELKIAVHAIGTMPDHVHLAISIPPSLAVAKAVGRIKGSAAHLINHQQARTEPLIWESEYSVHSFGARHLTQVVGYVTNQPARHAAQQTWSTMEPEALRIQPA